MCKKIIRYAAAYLLLGSIFICSLKVVAAPIYNAQATAVISSLYTDSAGGLNDLGYLGSSLKYDASAQASFDDGILIDLETSSYSKTTTQAITFASLINSNQLDSTLTTPMEDSFITRPVKAITDEAAGFGSGNTSGDDALFELVASVNGTAFDTGDPSFANSKVRWDLSIIFQNLSLETLTASWVVDHALSAAAQADANSTAFAVSTFEAIGAEDVQNAAGDPVAPDADKNLVANPPLLLGRTFFNFELQPGEIKTLSLSVAANGNAKVSEPPGILITISVLWVFILLRFRRKKEVSLVTTLSSKGRITISRAT